jgi:hypothetical protein
VAAPRRLPPASELAKLVEAGFTHQQIADHVHDRYGQHVSRSTVSVALSRAGLAKDAMRYKDELPWKVKSDHLTQYPARMLRLLGRRRSDIDLTDEEAERLEAWLEGMGEKGLVVAYVPDGSGFIYVYADERADAPDGLPIRKRNINTDEIEGLE